ncbi:MAG TPA: ATP-binding protein [candidate division Zixibacteria bacterium]|nr:ATP-binding protein [candidate division Zixibacteria bacterium]
MRHRAWQRPAGLAAIGVCSAAVVLASLISAARWVQRPFPGFFVHANLTVGPYFLPQWTGTVFGLETFDRVSQVNGSPIADREQLYTFVRSAPPGTSFEYTIERGGESRRIAVPSMTFSFHDWVLSFGLFLLMGSAFLLIGAAPYYYRSTSPAVFPLCWMVVNVFVWFGTTFDFVTAGAWPKEIRIFAFTLTPSAGVHLGLCLADPRRLRRFRRTIVGAIYGVSVALGTLYAATFDHPAGWWTPVYRAGYAYACAAALVFLALLAAGLREASSDVERSRLRVMAVGAAFGFFLPTLGAVLASSFRWPIPYNVSLIPTIFFPLSVAYGLLKYSLFDLGNALKAGLSRFALFLVLMVLYAAVVLLVGPSVGLTNKDPLIPVFFAIVVISVFNPVLRRIEAMVDRFIFRQEYDPVEVQKEVSLFLRSLATARELAAGFITRVTALLRIQQGCLVYRPQGKKELVVTGTGRRVLDGGRVAAIAREVWDERGRSAYQGISRGEVETDPVLREKRVELAAMFEAMEAEVLFPVVFEDEVRGLVGFGAKAWGREYTAEDLRLLGTLTDQLALALENGSRYEDSEAAKEEYRRLYDEAEVAKRKLIESDRVKKQFVANICHELRTPVSTILGYGEILLDPQFRGDSRAILQRLIDNGQDLSQLMDSLLDFSQLEADALPNQLEPVNLREILGGLEVMTQRLIRGRPIEFRIHIEAGIETVYSDARKVQKILLQLLTNALKFTERGEVELRIRTLREEGGSRLEIAVADTGIGIDRKDHELIFEDFRQLDGSSTRHYGGTGLGLSLSRRLAKALGGTIRVSSALGAGSVFSLILPITPPGPASPALAVVNSTDMF